VVERRATPAICVVAVAALALEMVGRWGMAGRTIGEACVVEVDRTPATGVVAVAALAGIVITWRAT